MLNCRIVFFSLACCILIGGFAEIETHAQDADKKSGEFAFPLTFGNTAADDATAEVTALLKAIDAQSVELQVTVILPEGHYTYSMNEAFGGATKIALTDLGPLSIGEGDWKADHEPKVVNDEILGETVEKFFSKVTWSKVLKGSVTSDTKVTGKLVGQYCGLGTCRPFEKPEFVAVIASENAATVAKADLNPVSISPEIGFGKGAKKGLIQFDVRLSPSHPKVGQEVILSVRATIKEPWHTFALDQNPEMAGTPTLIKLSDLKGLKEAGEDFTPSVEPQIERPLDDIVQRIHFNEVTWSRRFTLTEPSAQLRGTITFQMCSNGRCLPPTAAEFALSLTAGTQDTAAAATETQDEIAKEGLLTFLLTAIGAGFVALLTPCVFPMIPVTVAFFLKQEEKKTGRSLRLAIVYCLSIIGAFTILGLVVAAVYGPTVLNSLANDKWLNLGFAVLFLLFGIMLLGVIDIQIPSWLLTWTSKRESAGGMVGVVFMALTFTLVSFTCTFAFVGSLLVLAFQGNYLWPVIGMLAFSTAFASPFFVLAMFPKMLKKLPRSGGWMNEVKFIIGLVEIAAAVKFLSVADIGFSVGRIPVYLTYNVFLVIWIILSLVAGVYLLGLLRKGPRPRMSLGRGIVSFLFLAFATRLIVGLAGMHLPSDTIWNLVAAFAPPQIEVRKTDELGYVIVHHKLDFALEFDRAVAQASKDGRPIFVDFTGVNCVNCRQMERTVLIEKQVVSSLEQLVRAQLYTDEVPGITDDEMRTRLRAINQNLQTVLVKDVALPNYLVISPDGKTVLSTFTGLDHSGGPDFVEFLTAGMNRWEEMQKPIVAVGGRTAGR